MECYGSQAATDSKEPDMSPRKAGKPIDAATLGRRAAHRTPATPGGDLAQLQKYNGSERAPATNPPRPRPASAPGHAGPCHRQGSRHSGIGSEHVE